MDEHDYDVLEQAVQYWIFEHNRDWLGVKDTTNDMLAALEHVKTVVDIFDSAMKRRIRNG